MKFKFFKIPLSDALAVETELNAFLSKHRIIHIDKHFIADAANSFWSICVSWVDNEGAFSDGIAKRRNKIDYKEVLNETDFTLYAKLRDLRKAIAERDAIPVYNIFTNEQLATMVQQCILTKSALLAVEGIGQTRVDKYAQEFLDCLASNLQLIDKNEESQDHT